MCVSGLFYLSLQSLNFSLQLFDSLVLLLSFSLSLLPGAELLVKLSDGRRESVNVTTGKENTQSLAVNTHRNHSHSSTQGTASTVSNSTRHHHGHIGHYRGTGTRPWDSSSEVLICQELLL